MKPAAITKIDPEVGMVFNKADQPDYAVIGISGDKISIRRALEQLACVFESTVQKLIREGYAVRENISFEISEEDILRQMKSPEGMLVPCPENPRDGYEY